MAPDCGDTCLACHLTCSDDADGLAVGSVPGLISTWRFVPDARVAASARWVVEYAAQFIVSCNVS